MGMSTYEGKTLSGKLERGRILYTNIPFVLLVLLVPSPPRMPYFSANADIAHASQ